MARKLRIAVSKFFGVVAVALCVLWARSYWWLDWLEGQRSGIYAAISSANGGIRFDRESVDASPQFVRLCSIRMHDPTLQGYPNHTFKFAWNTPVALAVVPHWFVGTVAAAMAAIPWVPWSRRFSLRTLLIATTLVAVVLGLAVWAGR